MELWFTMENYGTMEKTMVLWTKLWYYTENYRTSIYEEKKHGRLQNTKKLWFIMEQTMEIYQNNWSFEQTYSLRTLIYYGKTMVLWKILWYYGKNYGTIPKTMELWFTMEKTMVLWKKLWYYSKL